MKLTGWRRLAVVLCGVWCIGAASLATYEALNPSDGCFVALVPPEGTVVSNDQVTLPNGQVFDLDPSNRGKTNQPWQIKWSKEAKVPMTRLVRWTELLMWGVAVPFGAWACLEILTLIIGWVARGFRERR